MINLDSLPDDLLLFVYDYINFALVPNPFGKYVVILSNPGEYYTLHFSNEGSSLFQLKGFSL